MPWQWGPLGEPRQYQLHEYSQLLCNSPNPLFNVVSGTYAINLIITAEVNSQSLTSGCHTLGAYVQSYSLAATNT